MPLVATLLERRQSVLLIRRAILPAMARVVVCRSPAHLAKLLAQQLVDVIILSATPARGPALEALRRDYPTLPLVLYAALRSDDAELLLRLQRERLVIVTIEGVDEPVLARRVLAHGVTARRIAALGPLQHRLDLVDTLQRRAWQEIVRHAPSGINTTELAARFDVSRETLSRRFSAGGAPALKAAMDAVRLFAAGQLLGNPAYRVDDVARLLKFSSASLLRRTARRTFGVAARALGGMTDDQWVGGLKGDGARGDWL